LAWVVLRVRSRQSQMPRESHQSSNLGASETLISYRTFHFQRTGAPTYFSKLLWPSHSHRALNCRFLSGFDCACIKWWFGATGGAIDSAAVRHCLLVVLGIGSVELNKPSFIVKSFISSCSWRCHSNFDDGSLRLQLVSAGGGGEAPLTHGR
jgi:hypothetical protein